MGNKGEFGGQVGPSLFGPSPEPAKPRAPLNSPRLQAQRIAALATRAERDRALAEVDANFTATVGHFCILAWAEILAPAATREAAQQMLAEIPERLVEPVRDLARSYRLAMRPAP